MRFGTHRLSAILSAAWIAVFVAPSAAALERPENDVDVYPSDDTGEWLDRKEYEHLIRELGLLVVTKTLAPSNTLGVNGFDIGVELNSGLIHGQESYWNKATRDGTISRLFSYPTIRIRKGLPLSVEGGMTIAYFPFTQQQVLGGQAHIGIHEGFSLVPDLAVHLSYDQYFGNEQLDLNVQQAVATLGYGFPFGDAGYKVGRISIWAGYGKGQINSQVVLRSIPAENAGDDGSDRDAFLDALGTDGDGFKAIRYDKWLGGFQVERGRFTFLMNGEFVDHGIPTVNVRWGAQF